jgi:hypothetical protein
MKATVTIEFDWDKFEQQTQVKSTKVIEPVFYALMLQSDEWTFLKRISHDFDELKTLCDEYQKSKDTAPYEEYYIVRQFQEKLETVYSGETGFSGGADFDIDK